MNYRHFSFLKKESKFIELSGDKQRAIETQANIAVEAHKISRYYKKYVILDSKALYYYPLTKDRYAYYEQLAKEKAKLMDNNIFIETQKHFKQFSR